MAGRIGQLGAFTACVVLAACQATSVSPLPSAEPTPPGPVPYQSPVPSASPTAGPSLSEAGWDSFGILPASQPVGFSNGIRCTGAIGGSDPVAIVDVSEAGGGGEVLMDYVDPTHPRAACTLIPTAQLVRQLVDPNHLVVAAIGDDLTFAVVDLPAVRYHWFALSHVAGDFPSQLIAVAPNLGEIAWSEVENGIPFDLIHLTNRNRDLVVAKLPDTNVGRCGSPTDSNPAAYNRSGSALFVLDEPLPEISLIVVKGGRLALSLVGTAGAATASRPLEVLWSPDSETLFYVQSGNAWRWTEASGPKVFLKGVAWRSATISPDGAHLAYDVIGPAGRHDVFLVDLAHGGKPVRINDSERGRPVFLNDQQLFYAPEFVTTSCGEAPHGGAIYNLETGSEVPTSIERVEVTWPAMKT